MALSRYNKMTHGAFLISTLMFAIAVTVVRSLPQGVPLPESTTPCTEESCERECIAAGQAKGFNTTTTSCCPKATSVCICCILPDCELTCQERRRKERPRSKAVRSRCNEKAECYCNFLWFDDNDDPMQQ